MINEVMWENSTKSKYVKNLMNDQNIMLGYSPPMENSKIEKYQPITFWWMFKVFFWYTPFYLWNIIYLAKILRALLSNKNGILYFWKSQWFNSYKTARDFNK